MMKKLLVLLLTAVMLLGTLTVGVSADVTLKDLIDYAEKIGQDEIYVRYNIAVNEDTVIPDGMTIHILDGATIDINKPLTIGKGAHLHVDGYVSNGSIENIVTTNGGNWSYDKLTAGPIVGAGVPTYNWQYLYNYYLQHGYYPGWYVPANPNTSIIGWCKTHTDEPIAYCTACKAWHCDDCGHVIVNPVPHLCSKCGSALSYCDDCSELFCYKCATHQHSGTSLLPISPVNYCYYHKDYKTYCGYCRGYYCTSCDPYHGHTTYPSDQYTYVPGYGWVYNGKLTVDDVEASIKSGSTVKNGAKVTLSTDTAGATIYYTTYGSIPTTRSTKYTGPIAITKDVTIKAIAVKSYFKTSDVSTFKYDIIEAGSFTDIEKFDGLDAALKILLEEGIVKDAVKYGPAETFDFEELCDYLTALGIDMDDVKIDKEVFEDKEALTYDDFVYITYRALRSEDLIDTPKTQGSKTIKQLPHYAKITDASIYRAAYVSFLENGLFYDVNINPSNNARRVDLAIAIAAVIENND